MKKCQYCTGENSDRESTCAFCGRPLPKPASKKLSIWAFLLISLVVIALCIGVASMISGGDSETSISPSESAWYACRQFVEDRLKAPKTADFERYDANKVTKYNKSEWIVTITVDAQNSFGAMIRSEFICSVRDQGDTWKLLSLEEY
ncbi:MAG: hypothetical protein C0401_12490 [Anaerolinea sp.]|nr:hypothetical protein [Anaerolinea sp.]